MKDAPRLRFILESVRTLGFVSIADVEKEFPERTKSSTWLATDKKTIESLGLPIRVTKRHFISMEPGTRRRTYALRKELDSTKKEDLSRAATALLAGHAELAPITKGLHALLEELVFVQMRENRKAAAGEGGKVSEALDRVKSLAQTLLRAAAAANDIRTVTESRTAKELSQALTALKSVQFAGSRRDVPREIVKYLTKSHRHVLIDSGTTNESIANDLRDQHFWSGPPYLTVYTNAPRIESVLEDSEIEVVGLMGEVRKDTSARTGFWNQRSLELLREITIDVAVVGTTGLALEKERIVGFACDSSDEAQTKAQMLSMARLRAVCADGSKLERPTSSAFVFANADASAVDILITDHSAAINAQKHLNTLAMNGIVVLVGGPAESANELGFWDPTKGAVVHYSHQLLAPTRNESPNLE